MNPSWPVLVQARRGFRRRTDDKAVAAYGLDDATITARHSRALERADVLAARLIDARGGLPLDQISGPDFPGTSRRISQHERERTERTFTQVDGLRQTDATGGKISAHSDDKGEEGTRTSSRYPRASRWASVSVAASTAIRVRVGSSTAKARSEVSWWNQSVNAMNRNHR